MADSWRDESPERAFQTLWETQHLGETLLVERSVHETIVPSEDRGKNLDFSLVTLPNLTGAGGAGPTHALLEMGPAIGRGGMAIVHLARQVALQRDVAVKALKPELRTPETTRVLLSEAWITGLLQHPNIVPVYELGRDASGSPLLVMKRITGTAWREFIRNPAAHAETFGKITPFEWHLGIFIQVCNAVHYAHSKGIIHRDLKPENVMIGEFGEVYLLDWGLAVSVDDTSGRFRSAASVDAIAGTPGYMAPEMVDWARHQISRRTDVYLLGAVLHEIMTGSPRHTGATIFDIVFSAYRSEPVNYGDEVPAELQAIVNRAAHADSAQRFESAEELRQAILEFLRHRESSELAREASGRLATLEQRISVASTVTDLEVYRSFGEARFGFEQALRVWSGNERARTGLAGVLRAMAEYELARGSFQAAAALIAELAGSAPDLEARLATLKQKVVDEQARVERLERLEKDIDVDVAMRTRAQFAAFLAAAWTILPFAAGFAVRARWIVVTWPIYIGQTATFGGVTLLGFYLWRKALTANEVNRRIISSAIYVYLVVLVHRLLAYVMGIPLPSSLAQELPIYFTALGLMAIGIDRRFFYSALGYLLSSFGAAFFPEYLYEWHGLGNFLGLASIALVWKLSGHKSV